MALTLTRKERSTCMKKFWMVGLIVVIALALALPGSVLAQTAKEKIKEKGQEVREKVEGQMTPEQKAKAVELKQKGQEGAEKIRNLTPEQKADLQKKAAKAVDKLQNLSPSQKAEIKKNLTAAVDKFKGMDQAEKDALKQELEKFKDLTPEQKDSILNSIFKKLKK